MPDNGFGQTCTTISETVRLTKDRVMGCNGQEKLALNLASLSGLKVAFIGSNRLQVYQADFGWGKPGLEALVSLSGDGEVVMSSGKEKDSVQITVGLKEDMEAFIHAFVGGLNSLKQ